MSPARPCRRGSDRRARPAAGRLMSLVVAQPQRRRRHLQRGAATLVTVMMLFFLMLLVAAYASRSLIFEQRTAANQYRATQAYEAADAGVQWTLAMLNTGKSINERCGTDAPVSDTFQQRYLRAFAFSDKVTPLAAVPAVGAVATLAACMHSSGDWTCQCPADGNPLLARNANAPLGFAIEMPPINAADPPAPITVRIHGCAGVQQGCLPNNIGNADAYVAQEAKFALLHALLAPPAAALTARGLIDFPSAVRVVNGDARSAGLTLHAGGSINSANAELVTPPGMPAFNSLAGDDSGLAALAATPRSEFFTRFSGITKEVYKTLPGLGKGDCVASPSACATLLRDAATAGHSILYASGNLLLDNAVLGSIMRPVMLVVDGNLTLQGQTQITGLVYATTLTLGAGASPTTTFVRGATVVEGDCCGTAPGSVASLIFDPDVLQVLKLSAGAYAMVAGSRIDR